MPPSPAEAALSAAAEELGRHALPAFLVALVAVVGLAGLLALALRRHFEALGPLRDGPLGHVALRTAAGFALVVVLALAFSALSEATEAEHALGRLDAILSAAIRENAPPATVQAFAWVTHLGDPLTLRVLAAVVAAALLVRGERALTLAWLAALGGNGALNRVLKDVFERARPVHDEALVAADGWSFPSGHASGSVVAYGMLAYLAIRTLPRAWHLPAVLLATAAAFTTGCSRVFLQAHYATDVAAGFASGIAWLAICIGSVEMTRHYRRRRARAA